MSLDFYFDGIKDKSVLFKDGKVPGPDESGDLKSQTVKIIFATMPVGINKITEDNASLFWTRYVDFMKAYGEQEKFWGFTEQDVKNHIGLVTNASSKSPTAFKKFLKTIVDKA